VPMTGRTPSAILSSVKSDPSSSLAAARTLDLLHAARRPAHLQPPEGYLDLLGDEDPTGPHPGQRWMASRVLPLIYERLWRPLGGRLLMGAIGPDMRGEHRIALGMLSLTAGERVLDVGCGPGNFTRIFAGAVSDGLVVGLDASRTMLARAVQETHADNVVYMRADACDLPFRDASFDAICCFAALYLIERPMRAVDEIARVLAPDGRVALLSSCNRGPLPAAITSPFVKGLTGVRIFSREELTGALATRGLTDVQQRVSGLAQFVAARKAAPRDTAGARR
jgi:SAM-dependent methyltransferase